ncbi:unnamed protein product, partial [Trichobilharzia szidati]
FVQGVKRKFRRITKAFSEDDSSGEDHQPIAKRLRASNASKSLKTSDSGKSPSSSQSSSKASPRIRKRIPLKELNVSTECNTLRELENSNESFNEDFAHPVFLRMLYKEELEIFTC